MYKKKKANTVAYRYTLQSLAHHNMYFNRHASEQEI